MGAIKSIAEECGELDTLNDKLNNATEIKQDKIFQQYVNLVEEISLQRPLILVIDNLQWADNASIGLLSYLANKIANRKVFIIGVYRTNEINTKTGADQHPLAQVLTEMKCQHGDIWIDLDAINDEEKIELINKILDLEPNKLDRSFREALFKHTSGQPLFVVELIKELKEQQHITKDENGFWISASDFEWKIIPARVEGVIESYLSRLEDNLKELLNIAAVEGDVFIAEIVSQILNPKDGNITKLISNELAKKHHIIKEECVEILGEKRINKFTFLNSIFREYIYNNRISQGERMEFHEKIADALEELFKYDKTIIATQLAHHYESALKFRGAITHYSILSQRAIKASAYKEAYSCLQKCLELIKKLPKDNESLQMELDANISLIQVYKASEGWNSEKIITAYESIKTISTRIRKPESILAVQFSLWTFYLMRGEINKSLKLAEDYYIVGTQLNNQSIIMQAHAALANIFYWMGDFSGSREHAEETLKIYDSLVSDAPNTENDPWEEQRTIAYLFITLSSWAMKDFTRAEKSKEALLVISIEADSPFLSSIALQGAALVSLFMDDHSSAFKYADKLTQIAQEFDLGFYIGIGKMLRGCASALSHTGDEEENIKEIQIGYTEYIGKGLLSLYSLILAKALFTYQRYEEGFNLTSSTLKQIEINNERGLYTEIHELNKIFAESITSKPALN